MKRLDCGDCIDTVHGCDRHLRGTAEAPPRDATAELRAELKLMQTAGIIEVAVRNPSVAEYMRHWEGRAEKAEAALKAAPETPARSESDERCIAIFDDFDHLEITHETASVRAAWRQGMALSETPSATTKVAQSPPETPADGEFAMDARVRDMMTDRIGTIVAVDTRYEIEDASGATWKAWHGDLESAATTASAETADEGAK